MRKSLVKTLAVTMAAVMCAGMVSRLRSWFRIQESGYTG